MGKEMGNNNTSALKEEDNTSEAEKIALKEDFHAHNGKDESQTTPVAKGKDAETKTAGLASSDTREHQNQMLQGDIHVDGVNGDSHTISTAETTDVMLKAAPASDDAIVVAGNDTLQEASQLIPTTEAEDVQDRATEMVSENPSTVEKDSFEGYTSADDVKVEDQMHATAEDIQEKAKAMASGNTVTLESDSLERYTLAGDMKFENHMHPTAEPEDNQKEAKGLAIDKTTTTEKDSLEGDTNPDYVRDENQQIPTAEAEDVLDKATALASDNSTGSFWKNPLEGDADADDVPIEQQMHPTAEDKNVEGKAARMTSDYATSKLQNHKSQKDALANDKQGEIDQNPVNEGIDATCLDSDDRLNVTDSSGSALEETTGVKQPEISHYTGSVEAGGQDAELLPHCTEEYEKEKEPSLNKSLLVTYDHHFDMESLIKQVPTEEEQTVILTLDDMSKPNDAELRESSHLHSNHNELVNILSESSILGCKLLHKSEILDNYRHCRKDNDDFSEKETETPEKKCRDMFDDMDEDEFGAGLKDTSPTTYDYANIGQKSDDVLLARVNYIADEVLSLLSESAMVDMPLEFDQWENSKVLYDENKATKGGPKVENGYHCNPGQCYEEPLKGKLDTAITGDVTRGSNGESNEERNLVLASRIPGIGNTHQVRERKVMENGHKIDVRVNDHSKTSDEVSTVPQEVFVVPRAEVDPLRVLDCRYEEGVQNLKTIIEGKNQTPEASYTGGKSSETGEISGQCKSHLVSIDKAKPFAMDTSASFLRIHSYQGNVNHTKTCTGTDMVTSDLKDANDKSFGTTADKLDSSNLMAPDLQLFDGKEFQKEVEDCSQQIEATSSKGAEITTSAATLSNEAYSSISAFANGGYEASESITRLSTESNSDNPNIPVHMQKSPSFNLNLRIEARPAESDDLPLLYHDKTEIESLSSQTNLNIMNSTLHTENGHCRLQQDEMPMEEKVVTMERSYSQKSKTPILGLLKEDEEARLLVTPQKEDNQDGTEKPVKEVRSASPKGKEKRSPRSSFFSSCMCCATMTN